MTFISHRGNMDGPRPERENSPGYIDEAVSLGFMVEVDLRLIGDQWFLGHDFPQYKVSWNWLNDREEHLLMHLKDVEAAKKVSGNWHYFCHSNDPYTFTSRGNLWIHEMSLVPSRGSIVPLMTKDLIRAYPRKSDIFAICSDYRTDHEGNVYVPRGTMQ